MAGYKGQKFPEHQTPKTLVLVANQADVLKAYSDGLSISRIAQRYGVYLNTVICFLKRRGVKLRTKSEAMKICWTSDDRARMSRQRIGIRTTFGRRWTYDRFISKPGIRGPLNGMWKGGTKSLQGKIRQCEFYKRWRTEIYKRDDFTCHLCGKQGGRLNVDHVIAFSTLLRWFSITTVEQAANCSAFWDTDNGRTLCVDCHKKTPNYAGESNKKSG